MKSKKVQTVASDEEMVRLDIYEGRIPLGEAGDRLLELALAQHHRGMEHGRKINEMVFRLTDQLEILSTPWPVRWWNYFKRARVVRRQTP